MEEAVKALETLCEKQGIKRFSSEEIVELLEDGESPDWIVEQVLPEGPDEAIAQLRAVLEPLADAVKPEDEDEAEGEEEGEAEGGKSRMRLLIWKIWRICLCPMGLVWIR